MSIESSERAPPEKVLRPGVVVNPFCPKRNPCPAYGCGDRAREVNARLRCAENEADRRTP